MVLIQRGLVGRGEEGWIAGDGAVGVRKEDAVAKGWGAGIGGAETWGVLLWRRRGRMGDGGCRWRPVIPCAVDAPFPLFQLPQRDFRAEFIPFQPFVQRIDFPRVDFDQEGRIFSTAVLIGGGKNCGAVGRRGGGGVDKDIVQDSALGVEECGVEACGFRGGGGRDVCGCEALQEVGCVLAVEGDETARSKVRETGWRRMGREFWGFQSKHFGVRTTWRKIQDMNAAIAPYDVGAKTMHFNCYHLL